MKNLLEAKYNDISKQIIFIEPALKVNELHLAISKNSANHLKKLRDFKHGMKKLLPDGTFLKILNSHNIYTSSQ